MSVEIPDHIFFTGDFILELLYIERSFTASLDY